MPSPVTILYHADCLDGFGAAYAAWCRFGDQACYRAMHHGEHWHPEDLAGHDVFILDFSFPPEQLLAAARIARSVIQIDHHVSALRAWAQALALPAEDTLFYQHDKLPLTIRFDLNRSGAALAWDHFFPARTAPLMLRHVEDQDLWRFHLPGTREFCRSLRLQAFDFALWDTIACQTPDTLSSRYQAMQSEGAAIEKFLRNETERLANSPLVTKARLRGEPVDALQATRHGQPALHDGTASWLAIEGLAINASNLFASELGHLLAERSGSFSLIWQIAGDGEAKASLRAAGRVDVARIASHYGGGGHPNAAGFRMPALQFMHEVLNLTTPPA